MSLRRPTGPHGEVFLLSAVRTPIGRFLGGLAALSAPALGAVAVRAALDRAGIEPAQLDEVILGQVVQAGSGQAPARQAALHAGIPATVPAWTVNDVCGSGLWAVVLAARSVLAGEGTLIVAGGMESMSRAPYLLPQARQGYRLGHGQVLDSLVQDGLWCALTGCPMGALAEQTARAQGVSRAEQDAYALASHRRAMAAEAQGAFAAERVPVVVPGQATPVERDEVPRSETSLAALARLAPAFQPDGTVTAGNASALADGAAALVVAAERRVEALGLRPLARITGWARVAGPPECLFTLPPQAIRQLCTHLDLPLEAFDLLEINEAFAAQAVANLRDLRLDPARVNVHGGAIALGHPIGASGARILVTLVHALHRYGRARGLASLCLGGGGAIALAVEWVAA